MKIKFVKTADRFGFYNVFIGQQKVAEMFIVFRRTKEGKDQLLWQFLAKTEKGEWDLQFVGHECAWRLREDCEAAIKAHFAKTA